MASLVDAAVVGAGTHSAGIAIAPFRPVFSVPPLAQSLRGTLGALARDGASVEVLFLATAAEKALVATSSVALALAAGALARGQGHRRARCSRPTRRSVSALRGGSQARGSAVTRWASGKMTTAGENRVPADFYELLGVTMAASSAHIKKGYYDKMKLCHPDVAGPDGEEMCMLLNDAYSTLGNSTKRAAYDANVQSTKGQWRFRPDPLDKKPTWKWAPRGPRNKPPQWTGRPYSRSRWDRVPVEERGEQWQQEQFVYVDEWSCIACRNCCDVAQRTFCITADAGRARVHTQWGNGEEDIDYAIAACPVDCIHWVSREELASLEYVTRDKLFDTGNWMPCPMAARQGNSPDSVDPFAEALAWKSKVERKQKLAREELADASSISTLQGRIQEAFARLSEEIRVKGWGRFFR